MFLWRSRMQFSRSSRKTVGNRPRFFCALSEKGKRNFLFRKFSASLCFFWHVEFGSENPDKKILPGRPNVFPSMSESDEKHFFKRNIFAQNVHMDKWNAVLTSSSKGIYERPKNSGSMSESDRYYKLIRRVLISHCSYEHAHFNFDNTDGIFRQKAETFCSMSSIDKSMKLFIFFSKTKGHIE